MGLLHPPPNRYKSELQKYKTESYAAARKHRQRERSFVKPWRNIAMGTGDYNELKGKQQWSFPHSVTAKPASFYIAAGQALSPKRKDHAHPEHGDKK